MMKSFKSHLTERKQLGVLYHFTQDGYRILKEKVLYFDPSYGNKGVSFTRKKFLSIKSSGRSTLPELAFGGIRLAFDGTAMSDTYHFEPFSWQGTEYNTGKGDTEGDQAEELLIPKKEIKIKSSWILGIDISIEDWIGVDAELNTIYLKTKTLTDVDSAANITMINSWHEHKGKWKPFLKWVVEFLDDIKPQKDLSWVKKQLIEIDEMIKQAKSEGIKVQFVDRFYKVPLRILPQ